MYYFNVFYSIKFTFTLYPTKQTNEHKKTLKIYNSLDTLYSGYKYKIILVIIYFNN